MRRPPHISKKPDLTLPGAVRSGSLHHLSQVDGRKLHAKNSKERKRVPRPKDRQGWKQAHLLLMELVPLKGQAPPLCWTDLMSEAKRRGYSEKTVAVALRNAIGVPLKGPPPPMKFEDALRTLRNLSYVIDEARGILLEFPIIIKMEDGYARSTALLRIKGSPVHLELALMWLHRELTQLKQEFTKLKEDYSRTKKT